MNDAPENSLTVEPLVPVAPAAQPRRRRSAVPLDPRRSPGDLAAVRQEEAASEEAQAETRTSQAVSIAGGLGVLRAALRNVPGGPGVYRMLDRKGDALYVGKARNLKSRIQNYTHPAVEPAPADGF